jgi:hypothetical protein
MDLFCISKFGDAKVTDGAVDGRIILGGNVSLFTVRFKLSGLESTLNTGVPLEMKEA